MRQNEAMRAELVKAGLSNPAFAKKWYEENEEGLRGGWDAARRDKELDADGVAGTWKAMVGARTEWAAVWDPTRRTSSRPINISTSGAVIASS